MCEPLPDYTETERGALALWYVIQAGPHGLTAVTLSRLLGVSRTHAYRLLWSVSRVAPGFSWRSAMVTGRDSVGADSAAAWTIAPVNGIGGER